MQARLVSKAPIDTYKIVIIGPFSSGRTTFNKTISEVDVVSAEKSISREAKGAKVKENITISLEFGRITSEDQTLILYLFGTVGNRRVDFIWEILAEGIMGCVFMINSRAPETFRESLSTLRVFRSYSSSPVVIAANFQDSPDAWDLKALRIALHIPDDIPIVPCVATDRESVKRVMIALLEEVLKDTEAQSE